MENVCVAGWGEVHLPWGKRGGAGAHPLGKEPVAGGREEPEEPMRAWEQVPCGSKAFSGVKASLRERASSGVRAWKQKLGVARGRGIKAPPRLKMVREAVSWAWSPCRLQSAEASWEGDIPGPEGTPKALFLFDPDRPASPVRITFLLSLPVVWGFTVPFKTIVHFKSKHTSNLKKKSRKTKSPNMDKRNPQTAGNHMPPKTQLKL